MRDRIRGSVTPVTRLHYTCRKDACLRFLPDAKRLLSERVFGSRRHLGRILLNHSIRISSQVLRFELCRGGAYCLSKAWSELERGSLALFGLWNSCVRFAPSINAWLDRSTLSS